jgi:hypothetical protein
VLAQTRNPCRTITRRRNLPLQNAIRHKSPPVTGRAAACGSFAMPPRAYL